MADAIIEGRQGETAFSWEYRPGTGWRNGSGRDCCGSL